MESRTLAKTIHAISRNEREFSSAKGGTPDLILLTMQSISKVTPIIAAMLIS